MALKMATKSVHGFDAPSAYHRVENTLLVNKDSMSFALRVYADIEQSAFFDEKIFDCAYEMSGDNPIKQAYEHLKTLPEFSTAEDV